MTRTMGRVTPVLSSVPMLSVGSAYPPSWRSAQGAPDVWQFSDGSSRALKF